MQLGQEAHQVAATSRVSILQSLYVSLVAGVCHLCLVCVTRGYCVQCLAWHCYCSCWQSLPLTHFRSHTPRHGAVWVRCWGASASPAPACCCSWPGRLWTGGSETLGLGFGGDTIPACVPDACPGPAPEHSVRARSTLQSWEGAVASASWQWSTGRAGCRQGLQQFPHYLAGGGGRG